MMWITALAIFVSIALVILWITALSNLPIFPRLRPVSAKDKADEGAVFPAVSVLIPARNEAHVITRTVRQVLGQSFNNLELLILDDNSEDATTLFAQEAGLGDPRLQVISGAMLSAGWTGKNWACHQLARAASGEYLLFLDADVLLDSQAVESILRLMQRTQADMLTVWPTQLTASWTERLVVPLMSLVILSYLPLVMVHYAPFAMFAAANGQCLCFRRAAYDRIGGHTKVRGKVVEDVALARRVKKAGMRLRMADGSDMISCKMYDSWKQVRHGFGKNILPGHGDNILLLLLSTVFHWLVFIGPWVWLALGWLLPVPGYPAWPLILVLAGVQLRALTAAFTRQRARDALYMPASVVLMTIIAVQAIYWQIRYGGPWWRDRVVKRTA